MRETPWVDALEAYWAAYARLALEYGLYAIVAVVAAFGCMFVIAMLWVAWRGADNA